MTRLNTLHISAFRFAALATLLNISLGTPSIRADDDVPFEILEETESKILYSVPRVPYPFLHEKENPSCFFSARELRLFQETFDYLPEAYQTLSERFVIRKKCELSDLAKLKPGTRIQVAMTKPGVIVIKDRAFFVIKNDGKRYLLSETLSKQIIAHELTHVLDRTRKLSKTRSFRQVNAWSRNVFFLMKKTPKKAEGFYRDQGAQGPKEDLATASEGYFFDPKFICEHPAMYMWFSVHVGPTLTDSVQCEGLAEPIHPEKVRAVGYMLVSATDTGVESRFGHAILHFHDDDGNPFNDILIQGAGNYPGAPVVTGQETPEEQETKRQTLMKIGRMDFLLKGATGHLDFVSQPMRYKQKWFETVVIQGRDIREKLLKLSPDQLRAIALIINHDVKRALGNYEFLDNNCATYAGETLNKVFASQVTSTNWLGAYTPKRVYKDITPVTALELPVTEGDLTRLKTLLPKRLRMRDELRTYSEFQSVEWDFIGKLDDDAKSAFVAREQLDLLTELAIELSGQGQLTEAQKKLLKTFLYSFNVEKNLMLKAHTVELYKTISRLPVKESP